MPNEILQIENFPQSNIGEITELTADANAAQNVINVQNADGYSVDDYIVVGNLGGEKSQLAQIQIISGLQITLVANLALKHYQGETITKIKSNQAKIYRAANVDGQEPADASFSTLAGTVNLQVDQQYTEFVDTVGGSDYWYLFTFYNSTSTSETAKSEAVKYRGGSYGLYANFQEVQSEAGLSNNKWIPGTVYQDKLIKAQSEVNTSLKIGGYVLPLTNVPEVVKHATILLAAGYVLTREYGPENAGTAKDGERKIKQAKEILKGIEDGTESLTDADGDPIDVESTGGRVAGYPDDTADSNTPAEERFFRTTDKF